MFKWLFDLSIAIIFWQLIMFQACYQCWMQHYLKDAKLHINHNEHHIDVKKLIASVSHAAVKS